MNISVVARKEEITSCKKSKSDKKNSKSQSETIRDGTVEGATELKVITKTFFRHIIFQNMKDLFGLMVDRYLNLPRIEIKTLEISKDIRNQHF
ncbi:3103_t:CDS:2 [Diversispora eburnea]|uniref:3103_t:CDS:1 n=1 Tax=Diversispora eburnea TaxID=1213867 RepID=A0A9N9BJB0_9GLOM|nr:3103_t:CDS:2 [Diversispora eburnea]